MDLTIARRRLAGLALGISILVALAGTVWAEPMEGKNNPVTFDGVLWAKWFYNVEDFSPGDDTKDFNAFQIDRVYLTFQSRIGERYTGRARLEVRNFNTSADVPRVWLKTADILIGAPFGLEGTRLRFGQTEGLISNWYERPWGYRIVAPTPPDLYLGNGTTWLGAGWSALLFDGALDCDVLVANHVPYNLSVGDPGDEGKYKTAGARAYVRPIREGVAKGWGIGGYAQYAPQVPDAGDNNTVWYGAHSFYEGKKLAAGVQYDARRRKFALLAPNDGTDEVTSQVISGLARYAFNEKIEAFARVDLVDYDTDADDLELVSPGFGDITDAAAQTVLFAGVSQAYSNSLRSVLDVRYRTLNDDVFVLGEKIDLDNEIVVSLRLDARL